MELLRRLRPALLAACVGASILVPAAGSRSAAAATCPATGPNVHTWTGAGDHVHWGDPNNWTPFGVPGAAFDLNNPPDVVCINHATDSVVIDNTGPDQSGTYSVKAVISAGTIIVQKGAELFVQGAPSTDPSTIATLQLKSATLGGAGKVTITKSFLWHGDATFGPSTLTTRELFFLPPVGTTTTAPPRLGQTVIAVGATALVDDVGNVTCADGGGSGVQLRDGRKFVNRGTFTIAKCAYIAADWGTRFDNFGTVNVQGGVGYFEGFLGRDLGWPTTPPVFVNNSAATIARKTNAGNFLMAARFSSAGTISIASGTDFDVLDSDPTTTTAQTAIAARAAGAAVGVTDCSSTPTNAPCDPVIVQSELFRNSNGPGAPTATISLQQDALNVGGKYAATGRTIAGETLTFGVSNGAPTSSNPFVVTITARPATGAVASSYTVGDNNAVLPMCGATITGSCIASRTIDANGVLKVVVKTTDVVGHMVPLGPRFIH